MVKGKMLELIDSQSLSLSYSSTPRTSPPGRGKKSHTALKEDKNNLHKTELKLTGKEELQPPCSLGAVKRMNDSFPLEIKMMLNTAAKPAVAKRREYLTQMR